MKLIEGRDGVVREARLRAGKSYLEHAIQHLCPMELLCDVRGAPPHQLVQPNPRARDFTPRRAAVVAAHFRESDIEISKSLCIFLSSFNRGSLSTRLVKMCETFDEYHLNFYSICKQLCYIFSTSCI